MSHLLLFVFCLQDAELVVAKQLVENFGCNVIGKHTDPNVSKQRNEHIQNSNQSKIKSIRMRCDSDSDSDTMVTHGSDREIETQREGLIRSNSMR
ncbi:MAG: hypothetical protein ACI8RD_006401 [Bacillariaceae sp.]|jgi:hypothetical protein